MWKARRFTETLAKRLIWLSQTTVSGNDQAKHIKALAEAGVVPLAQRRLFDRIRKTGNRAVHTYYGDILAALTAVKNCFELGYWFYRASFEDRAQVPLLAFVPPPDPQALKASEDAADQAELDELRRELDEYRRRLVDVKVRRDAKVTQLEAETRARADAEQALRQARAGHDRLQALLADADERTRELRTAFEAQLKARRKVTAVERDRLVEGAQRAAAQPLTENEVRQHVDDMLRAAGWAVQDISQVNLYAADGVAVREVSTAAGPADYLLWVDRKLVGVIEAKRQGTILTPVEGQSGRYADTGVSDGGGWPPSRSIVGRVKSDGMNAFTRLRTRSASCDLPRERIL